MRDFGQTAWSPPGSRPHVEVPVGGPVADLADAYVGHARNWWDQQPDDRAFDDVFHVVASRFLHMTLGWALTPSSDLPAERWDDLEQALRRRLDDVGPVDVMAGPLIPGYVAAELYVAPCAELDQLAGRAGAALRDVLGPDGAARPAVFCPHVTVFYGRAQVDTDGLTSRLLYAPPPDGPTLLRPVPLHIDRVLLVEQDTYKPGGLAWDERTARAVYLAGASPAKSPGSRHPRPDRVPSMTDPWQQVKHDLYLAIFTAAIQLYELPVWSQQPGENAASTAGPTAELAAMTRRPAFVAPAAVTAAAAGVRDGGQRIRSRHRGPTPGPRRPPAPRNARRTAAREVRQRPA